MATATLSYNLNDLIGEDFDPRRTKVWITANVPLIVVDGTTIRLDNAPSQSPASDGTGSFTLVTTNSAVNPTSFAYVFHVDYALKGRQGNREQWHSSEFTFTTSANIAAISEAFDGLAIAPTWQSEFRAEMEAIAGLTGEDAAIANRVNTPGSDTDNALKGRYDRKSQIHAADYANLAFALAAASSGSVDVVYVEGTNNISSPITVPANVELRLAPGAVINNTVWNQNAVVLSAGSALRGGTIASPATWDGTNSTWTYAVVMVTGDNATVDGVTLSNVPRVGIGIQNVNGAIVTNCRINGNYPSAQWTEVETVHFGIGFDPGGVGVDGNIVISGNIIDQCVQGVFLGNYTGGGTGRGIAVTGNSISNCWNHGVYGYGNNFSVAGNSFNRTQIPVALSGNFHTVSGNSIYTPTTGGTDQRDDTGISIRDCTGCVVIGNTIRGNAKALSAVIDVRALTGTVCSDNSVIGNVIHVEGGSSVGIRIGNGATTCDGNTVQGNTVRCNGNPSTGVIALVNSSTGRGNSVINNTVVMEATGHGIYVAQQQGAMISGNHVRQEYDAASAITLGMVFMVGNSSDCTVQGNVFATSAAWGTNVTIRAIYENSGTTGNRYINNTYLPNTTKLAAYVPLFTQGGGALVNESGPGAPNFAAGVGSLWRRTDGGAATTLYVKESGVSSAGWVGK